MVAAMATMASMALPPSAIMARPASTAAACGAQTTPRRWPALCRSTMLAPSLPSPACGGGEGGGFGETALAQERVGARQPAAKRLVGVGGILRAAGGVDGVVQPLGGRGIENVAGLLECREGVGIEH